MADISLDETQEVIIRAGSTSNNELEVNSDGSIKSIVRSGVKGTSIAADITSTNQSADRQALDVQIRNSSGGAVDTFGGGQQYADGTVRGTATGTLAMGDDGANIQSLSCDSSGRLNVNQGIPNTAANSWPVKITDTVDTLAINSDGSINVAGIVSNTPAASNISTFVSQGKVFTISAQINQANAGSDNPLFLIKNPVASGKTLYLYRVLVGMNVVNTNTNVKIWNTPTITSNGSAVTPVNTNIGHANSSSMNVYDSATVVSSTGTQMTSLTVGQNNNSIDYLGDFSIWLGPGKNLLITGNPNSNNREASVTVVWAEV